MKKWQRIAVISISLWVGTFIYGFLSHQDMLVAVVIDRCWFEFTGVLAYAVIADAEAWR
jgi:uncharacterized membrane protein